MNANASANDKKRILSSNTSFNEEVEGDSIYNAIRSTVSCLIDDVGVNLKKISSSIQKSKVPKSNTNMQISDVKNVLKNLESKTNSYSLHDINCLEIEENTDFDHSKKSDLSSKIYSSVHKIDENNNLLPNVEQIFDVKNYLFFSKRK